MEFSFEWICQYVDPQQDAARVADRLTAAGLAVEGQETRDGDVIFDIDVTTNRPDCMNHFGLAREVAALTGRPLTFPETETSTSDERADEAAKVDLEDPVGCPRYVARLVRGVRVGPSPEWLVRRLAAIGQRSINNIVDITNFVLWELGQPIHAFDLARLTGSRIIVRRARPGERLVTLDGEDRELDEQVLVIADAERAVALAGIMGGLDSEVTSSTNDILIESAHFDPTRIRLGAGRLGLHTDANHRFERGADPEICRRAADRVAALVAEVAGGEVLEGAVDERHPDLDWRLSGELDLARAAAFGGVHLDAEQVVGWLSGIGFELAPQSKGTWQVTVPSWRYYDMRPDPSLAAGVPQAPVFEADLFEEVLRLHGFEGIPSTLPDVGGPDAGSSAGHWRREGVRRHLAVCGYSEAVTFSFHDAASTACFPGVGRQAEPLVLANPISELYTTMQRSLLPGLVEAAQFNLRRGAGSVRLFEIGHLFPGSGVPELEAVALVAGGSIGTAWDRHRDFDFFDLKGTIESLAARFGRVPEFRPVDLPGFVAGTAAAVHLVAAENDPIGYLGQLAIDDGAMPLFAAELRTDPFVPGTVQPVDLPSRHPGIQVDLTLTHAATTPWSDIAAAIEAAAVEDLVDFGLEVRYAGEGVPTGAVNTTLYFLYNAEDRSLKQEEVNERHEAVRRQLTERFGWKGST
jgi:phenylalanyl-tRNA synthetase beta chain